MRGFAVTLLLWVMGTMSRADAPRGDSLMHEVVQGNNQFAIDIYARLRQQPGNLFFSPYSLSTALAMTYAGARGETAEQMAKTLHFDCHAGSPTPGLRGIDPAGQRGQGPALQAVRRQRPLGPGGRPLPARVPPAARRPTTGRG